MADLTDAYSALQAADSAGNTADAKQLADYIRSQSAAPPATDPGTDPARQVALTGRAASQGVVGALTLPNTIMTAARNTPAFIANKLFGGNFSYQKSVAEQYSDAMTKAGAPVPQTSGENLAAAGVSGLTGGLATGGLTSAQSLANAIRSGAAGTSGGLSQETAKQMGMPAWLQVGAGLLGSQAPAMAESYARTASSLVAPLTASGQRSAVGTMLNQQARDPNAAITNLQSSAPLVPGSMPTSGAASGDIGLLGIEKYARQISAPAFGERLSEQNLARQTELGVLAGAPSDLKAAISTRSDIAAPMYAAARDIEVPSTPELEGLLQRPSMASAWKRAQQLASERGDTLTLPNPDAQISLAATKAGPRSAIDMDPLTLTASRNFDPLNLGSGAEESSPLASTMASPRTSSQLDPLSLMMKPPALPVYSGKTIQYLKMALSDIADKGPQNGMGSHELGAVKGTLGSLNAWTTANVPSLRAADSKFAELSPAINRMQTLQELQGKVNLTAADPSTGQYFMSPAGLNRALTAMKDDPFNGVTVADNSRLSALLKDLESSQAVNGPLLKAPGSDTFQNLSLRQNLGGLAGIAGKPLEALYNLGGSDKAIQGLITQAMLDPKLAAALMQRAAAQQGRGLNFRPYDAGALGGLLGSQP